MEKYYFMLPMLAGLTKGTAQELTGTQLLNKAIAYHDPNGSWDTFQGKLFITMNTPDGKVRLSEVEINLPAQYFKLTASQEGTTIEQTLEKGNCTLKLNGSTTISTKDKKTYRISCERASTMKDYYTYLYGLPMKLRDPGTLLDPKVQTKTFKGKKYQVLKVSYDEKVGKDVWYFYFDPVTFAMEVYQFFHDESKNDGEYIILNDIENVNSIKMPKTRAWYYNSDDKYLGTDILTNSERL
jgi:uncharacterized protein DUF6503